MRRSKTGVGIYVISLDTFMLLAVLGITIGVLFIIISPMLDYEKVGPDWLSDEFMCTKSNYDYFINEMSFKIDVDDGFNPINYKIPDGQQIIRYYNPTDSIQQLIGQIRKVNNSERRYLEVWVGILDNECKISLLGRDNDFIEISDEDMQAFLKQEYQFWPELEQLSEE